MTIALIEPMGFHFHHNYFERHTYYSCRKFIWQVILVLAAFFSMPLAAQQNNCPQPDQQMLEQFRFCAGGNANLKDKNALLVDTDQKWGYTLDDKGNILTCFTITVGKGGVGRSGPPQTEPGMFFTQFQNGAKYQTNNPDFERKGISMGIGGRIIHSAHGNSTTLGCIGIQQEHWPKVFEELGTKYAPVYVYAKAFPGCGRGKDAAHSDNKETYDGKSYDDKGTETIREEP